LISDEWRIADRRVKSLVRFGRPREKICFVNNGAGGFMPCNCGRGRELFHANAVRMSSDENPITTRGID
jgi:hypothetical protein